MISFVCSIGNVPAGRGAVERRHQLRRRGRLHLRRPDHPADPVIYRKYYGTRMALFLLATFYVAMVAAGYVVEILFGAAGLIPTDRNARSSKPSVALELHDLPQHRLPALAAVLVARSSAPAAGRCWP